MEAVNFADDMIVEEVLGEGSFDKTADPVALIPQIQTNKKSLAHTDLFQRYFAEIKRHKLLTREEEKELATKVREKGDPEAVYQLVLSNLRLVVKIAFDFQKSWPQSLLDLIQEGNLGLMKAVNKFDPDRGVKFSYYASFWIKAYMSKHILDNFRLIKLGTTQNQRKLFFNLGKEKENLINQGLEPRPGRLAERLNVKEAEVVEMSQRLGKQERSMDSPIGVGPGEAFGERLADKSIDIEEELALRQHRRIFSKKITEFREQLSGREADIFDSRLVSENPVTLQKLGDKYDVSRERIRQIQAKLIKKMRHRLRAEIPDFKENYAGILN